VLEYKVSILTMYPPCGDELLASLLKASYAFRDKSSLTTSAFQQDGITAEKRCVSFLKNGPASGAESANDTAATSEHGGGS
jgi:hypothetical protein